tara:strand:- start:388 stop:600 length:213 start_codon:yes stop_codon:yes gene_type:complete
MTKKIKNNIIDLVNLEIQSRKSGHNGNGRNRLKFKNSNLDLMNSKDDYKYLDGYNRRIYQGYKVLTIDEK